MAPSVFFVTGRRISFLASLAEIGEKALEQFEAVIFCLFNLSLLDFEQVVVVIYFLFTLLTEIEVWALGTFEPDSDDGSAVASLALESFVNHI